MNVTALECCGMIVTAICHTVHKMINNIINNEEFHRATEHIPSAEDRHNQWTNNKT